MRITDVENSMIIFNTQLKKLLMMIRPSLQNRKTPVQLLFKNHADHLMGESHFRQ